MSNQPAGYTGLQIGLHWVIFLLVAVQVVFHDPIAAAWEQWQKDGVAPFSLLVASHVVIGILILLLVFWRISIKARRGAPPMPENITRAQHIVAHATHGLLYLLLILMPISGMAAWFGGVELAATAHSLMRIALIALILLHAVAAIYHHFILKTDIFRRMLKPEA
ncbi:MAG: cytochrome b [Rhodobacteraceae bacterium]|nr:cytochrome b [Paracoccaceae bacterium]